MKCCKALHIPTIFAAHPDVLSFYEARGIRTVIDVHGRVIIEIQGACPQLTLLGCKIYTQRPIYCRVYDGRRDPYLRDECLWGKEQAK